MKCKKPNVFRMPKQNQPQNTKHQPNTKRKKTSRKQSETLRFLISTKEPQAQRIRYTYLLYVSTAYLYRYIYIYLYAVQRRHNKQRHNSWFRNATSLKNNDTKMDFEDADFFSFFLFGQCELRGERPNVHLPSLVGQGERPNVHLPSLVGQRPHQQYRM